VDWAEEARRIAASEPLQFGRVSESGVGGTSPSVGAGGAAAAGSYVLTGDGGWLKATVDERRAVVGAFATNTTIESAGFANCVIDDALGALWGEVLKANTTLTSLNLESNELQTAGIDERTQTRLSHYH
jgi:hypothetical protein